MAKQTRTFLWALLAASVMAAGCGSAQSGKEKARQYYQSELQLLKGMESRYKQEREDGEIYVKQMQEKLARLTENEDKSAQLSGKTADHSQSESFQVQLQELVAKHESIWADDKRAIEVQQQIVENAKYVLEDFK